CHFTRWKLYDNHRTLLFFLALMTACADGAAAVHYLMHNSVLLWETKVPMTTCAAGAAAVSTTLALAIVLSCRNLHHNSLDSTAKIIESYLYFLLIT
ncbi:hypothetical protein Tco_0143405, partial [Tanacetum coccineum]